MTLNDVIVHMRQFVSVDGCSSLASLICRAIMNCLTCTMTSFSVIGSDEVDVIRWRKPLPGKLNTPAMCKMKVIWFENELSWRMFSSHWHICVHRVVYHSPWMRLWRTSMPRWRLSMASLVASQCPFHGQPWSVTTLSLRCITSSWPSNQRDVQSIQVSGHMTLGHYIKIAVGSKKLMTGFGNWQTDETFSLNS